MSLRNSQHVACLEKQKKIMALFGACEDEEARYAKIIALGRQLPSYPSELRSPEYVVRGCQSTLYLHSRLEAGCIRFAVESEALISAGLAAILIFVYDGETAETVLTCPPDYLATLGISASLTPSRANGLYSIHLRMKQDALHLLVKQN